MNDEPRAVRPPRVPSYPHPERCPKCGEDGRQTDRCISHVGKGVPFLGTEARRYPTSPRTLECGACGHHEILPTAYQPQQPPHEPYAGDYLTWKAQRGEP